MEEDSQLHQVFQFPAEILDDPYYRKVPLAKITGYQQLDKQALPAEVIDDKASHTWQPFY